MKCPICGAEYDAPFCPECGYDGYLLPETENPPPAAAEPLQKAEDQHRSAEPAAEEKPRGRDRGLIAAVCAAILCLCVGIWIGVGIGKPEPTEPTEPAESTAAPDRWQNNILRSDEVPDANGDGFHNLEDTCQTPVFDSDYRRDQIFSVTFLDTLAEQPDDAWDVSEAGDGSVMAWVKPNGELYDLYIGAEGGVSAGASCEYLFMGYENVRSITFGDAFHIDGTEDISWMFYGCGSLTELTLGDSFDTSNVRDMSYMFCNCSSLTELTFGEGFDTSNVQKMRSMFASCSSLTELTFGEGFDTSNVQDMLSMFDSCSSLTELTLGDGFDTSNVQNMSNMFYNCISLTKLTLGKGFDTSNVKKMRSMFRNCSSLTELTLGDGFVTTNADTKGMFWDCPAGDDYQHLVH